VKYLKTLIREHFGEIPHRRILTWKFSCRRHLNELEIDGGFNWLWMGLVAGISGPVNELLVTWYRIHVQLHLWSYVKRLFYGSVWLKLELSNSVC
jgi:hypothetical protein